MAISFLFFGLTLGCALGTWLGFALGSAPDEPKWALEEHERVPMPGMTTDTEPLPVWAKGLPGELDEL